MDNLKDLCTVTAMYNSNNSQYRKRLEAAQAIERQQEDWTVRLKSDGPSYPAMLKRQREENQIRETKVGAMDRAAANLIYTRAQMGRSTTVGDVEYFLRRMESDSTAAALYNAQRTLAYERAKFTADCAARNISTAVDAERAWKRIAVARAEVVRQEI